MVSGSRESSCCGSCCLCKRLFQLIIFVGFFIFSFWVVVLPHRFKAYVDAASLAHFGLADDNINNTLQYNLSLDLAFRNPNQRIGIYYDHIEATALLVAPLFHPKQGNNRAGGQGRRWPHSLSFSLFLLAAACYSTGGTADRTSTGCTPGAGGGHRPPFRPGEAASTPPGSNQDQDRLLQTRPFHLVLSLSLVRFLCHSLPL